MFCVIRHWSFFIFSSSARAAWPGFGFGTAYEALGAVLPAMLLATSGEAVSRLLATKANARGRPWHVVAAEVVRAAVLLGGGLTALAGAPLGAFAWLWAAAAWLTAATLAPMARAVPEAGSVNGVRS